jgi:hypothetical protein
VKTITLTVENSACTSYDTLQIFVTNSPVLCGNALIISGEAMSESAISIGWEYLSPDTTGLTFEVEWSTDAIAFTSLGGADFAAQNALGWQFEKMHYSPEPGNNYYRIQVTDEFGQQTFSSVMKVEIDAVSAVENTFLEKVKVYPNPFGEALTLVLPAGGSEALYFELHDAVGKTALKEKLNRGETSFYLPTGHLAPGVYFAVLRFANGHQRMFRLVK